MVSFNFDIDQELVKRKEEKAKLRNENSDLKQQLDNFMYTKDKFKKNKELQSWTKLLRQNRKSIFQ